MAKRGASFIDLHVEKLVIGLCVVVLGAAAFLSFGGGRFTVDQKNPAQLASAIGEAADQTRSAMQSARLPDSPPPGAEDGAPKSDFLKNWYSEGAKGLIPTARIEPSLFRAQPFPAPMPFSSQSSGSEKRNLAQIVPPSIPIVMAGKGSFQVPVDKPTIENPDADAEEFKPLTTSYVVAAAQVDLVDQEANFLSERYPEGSHPLIVKVHMQRMDISDPGRGWEDVDTYSQLQPFKRPKIVESPDGKLKLAGVDLFKAQLESIFEEIERPRLPGKRERMATRVPSPPYPPLPYIDTIFDPPKLDLRVRNTQGDMIGEAPDITASKRTKKWADLAAAALKGTKPFREVDYDAALLLARSAVGNTGPKEKELDYAKQVLAEVERKVPRERKALVKGPPRSPERLLPIMAIDLSPVPGRTYTYRMRYEILNIYAANVSELNNPADAKRLTVFSEWSPPSRPVEIKTDLYFFLTKADRAKREAVVTVFRSSKRGGTDRQEYKVKIGDPIGRKEPRGRKVDFSTGAVCIDLDFDRVVEGKKDVALIYAEGDVLREKLLSRDTADKKYKELLEERAGR